MNLAEERAARKSLDMPKAVKTLFARNFIQQAVCELRFPTLYELDVAKPPPAFSKALRKEYPNQESVKTVNLAVGDDSASSFQHSFRSRGQKWTATLRTSAVVLETADYGSFDEFRSRVEFLVNAAKDVIDSDFFTRVGLRYINALPYERETIGEWVNPALVGALGQGLLGDPIEYAGRVIGVTEIGGYIIQHGILTPAARQRSLGSLGIGQGIQQRPSLENQTEYSLDFDLYSEDVPAGDVLSTVDRLHELEYSVFDWALGPLAKQHLGPSVLEGAE